MSDENLTNPDLQPLRKWIHDLNNRVGVILATAELLQMEQLSPKATDRSRVIEARPWSCASFSAVWPTTTSPSGGVSVFEPDVRSRATPAKGLQVHPRSPYWSSLHKANQLPSNPCITNDDCQYSKRQDSNRVMLTGPLSPKADP